jgi:hypothetical protein
MAKKENEIVLFFFVILTHLSTFTFIEWNEKVRFQAKKKSTSRRRVKFDCWSSDEKIFQSSFLRFHFIYGLVVTEWIWNGMKKKIISSCASFLFFCACFSLIRDENFSIRGFHFQKFSNLVFFLVRKIWQRWEERKKIIWNDFSFRFIVRRFSGTFCCPLNIVKIRYTRFS